MATLKKAALKKTVKTGKASVKSAKATAENATRNLVDTAQQIWSAGVGALARAQGEGTDLFDALVKKGMNLEAQTRKLANGKVNAVRGAVEGSVDNAREKATDTWDRMEKVFEDRVQKALTRLGVPTREDLTSLNKRVETLTAELRKQPAASKKAAPAKAAEKQAKVVTKAVKNALPKTIKPVAPKA